MAALRARFPASVGAEPPSRADRSSSPGRRRSSPPLYRGLVACVRVCHWGRTLDAGREWTQDERIAEVVGVVAAEESARSGDVGENFAFYDLRTDCGT